MLNQSTAQGAYTIGPLWCQFCAGDWRGVVPFGVQLVECPCCSRTVQVRLVGRA